MAPAAKKPVYIGPANPEELLDEMYSWLVVHAENCHKDGCKQCWRMNRVKKILMMPFRDERHYPIQIHMREGKGAGK